MDQHTRSHHHPHHHSSNSHQRRGNNQSPPSSPGCKWTLHIKGHFSRGTLPTKAKEDTLHTATTASTPKPRGHRPRSSLIWINSSPRASCKCRSFYGPFGTHSTWRHLGVCLQHRPQDQQALLEDQGLRKKAAPVRDVSHEFTDGCHPTDGHPSVLTNGRLFVASDPNNIGASGLASTTPSLS